MKIVFTIKAVVTRIAMLSEIPKHPVFAKPRRAKALTSLCWIVLLQSFVLLEPVAAQWSSDPAVNTTISGSGRRPKITTDRNGGSIITWASGNRIYAQRLNASGIPQWANGGIPLASASTQQQDPSIVSDGSDGAIITWTSFTGIPDIYAQRVNGAGILQWGPDGVPVCQDAGAQTLPLIVSDGSNGAVITWKDSRTAVFAQRLNGSGVPQWTPNGLAVCPGVTAETAAVLTEDNAGGAILAWPDPRNGTLDIYAQRITNAGTTAWANNGVPISNAAGQQTEPRISADGGGGALIIWTDSRNGAGTDVYAQRLNSNGATLWTADGLPICTAADVQASIGIIPDGIGGAIASWTDRRNGNIDIYALRINTVGSVVDPVNGVAIATDPAEQSVASMTSDGTGGAIITWMDYRNNNYDIYAQRFGAAGAVLWSINGRPVATSFGSQGYPTLVNDGNGGAVVCWEAFNIGVSAQNVNPDGSLGIQEPRPSISSFSPAEGYTGDTITIVGSNFANVTAVAIDGLQVSAFSIVNASTIRAQVNSATVGTISVISAVGTGTSPTNFNYRGYISAANGNWTSGTTWRGGNPPPSGAPVTIDHDVVLNAPVINHAPLTIHPANSLVLASQYTNSSTLTVSGTLELTAGSVLLGNSPVYSETSILQYNTAGTFAVGNEWRGASASAGTGVPARIEILSGTVNMPAADCSVAGSLVVAEGNLNLNNAGALLIGGTGGSLYNQSSGTLVANNSTVIFHGLGKQNILTNGVVPRFYDLIVDKPAGTLISINGIQVDHKLSLLNSTIAIADVNKAVHVDGDIIRTNGFVIGYLSRNLLPGSNTLDFAVGTMAGYTPATLTVSGVGTAGTLKVMAVDGKSNNYPSGFSSSKFLDRNWSVQSTASFATASAAFVFLEQDLVETTASALAAYKFNTASGHYYPAPADFTINGTSYVFNNITSFSEFGAGVAETSLPVTLVSFTGSLLSGSIARLSWRTGLEENFSHFILEKKVQGNQYESTRKVLAKGDNSHYIADDTLLDATASYRLKMVDHDGRFEYSKVIRLVTMPDGQGLTIFPNPVVSSTSVRHPRTKKAGVLSVDGLDGRRLLLQWVSKDAEQTTIDCSSLPAGTYILSYREGDDKRSVVMVKQ